MKKNKKILAMLMAVVMLFCFNTTVFADSGIPAGVEKHTITLEVPAADSSDGTPGIQPRMWDQQNPSIVASGSIETNPFDIPDRYFAYEMKATSSDASASYTVSLYRTSIPALISSMGGTANGITKKNDWISVTAGKKYYFEILNNSSSQINVTVTYYSWA